MTNLYVKDSDLAKYVYDDICEEAEKIGEQYKLTDIQINLYNHICRGDFCFRDGDGDMFFNPNSNGIGWSHDRKWVQKQLRPLLTAGIVTFEKIKNRRNKRYTDWYFYDSRYKREHMVVAGSLSDSRTMFELKKKLNLPDGWFHSPDKKIGDLEWQIDKHGYIKFRYKGKHILYEGNELNQAVHYISPFVESIENPYTLTAFQKQKIEEDVIAVKEGKKERIGICLKYARETDESRERKRELQEINNYIAEMKEKYELGYQF